jgi:3-methylfumaryl-CoA hydratase
LDWTNWIGRTESSTDTVTPASIAALSATLDRDDPTPLPGDPVPLLWHWLYFLPRHRESELDVDGHARRGDFLPPVPLPRRMYAGGRVEAKSPLRVGDRIGRVSRIVDVTQKEGRSGPLVFVKVRHEISRQDGLVLVEDHDIVYRDRPKDAVDAARPPTGRGRAEPEDAERVGDGLQTVPDAAWERESRPDEVLLFRYSALTFNGYRIHYDRRYATEVQGYPGLVVHAPLVATLLADLLRRHLPQANVCSFVFRAVRPLFDGVPFRLCGRPGEDRRSVKLWARGPDGERAFEATALIAIPNS